MKKLAWILVIILLLVIAFFLFRNYQRFHPGTDYDYQISSEIDTQYHDPRVVLDYYETAHQVGTFARSVWRSEGIDVRFPDAKDFEETEAARRYEQLLATAQFLENQLESSQLLKVQGFSNADIKELEATGLAPEQLTLYRQTGPLPLKKGDQGAGVIQVQKLLVDQGFTLPVDGIFVDQTETALRQFQAQNGLVPTGMADAFTLQKLIKTTSKTE